MQLPKVADHWLKTVIPKDASVLIRLPLSRDIYRYMASAVHKVISSESITRAEQAGRKQS